ncbi:unnamed protein product [Onchocerca ochengi]|uniref:HAT C-terminal dimerisation domain-containing protein n=1 Tax=Onchocerca ochengi TaxID=42157 RepID=A0A182EFB0_ONCOC|nr:unnamed protein product [Onchocerca ochengi]
MRMQPLCIVLLETKIIKIIISYWQMFKGNGINKIIIAFGLSILNPSSTTFVELGFRSLLKHAKLRPVLKI